MKIKLGLFLLVFASATKMPIAAQNTSTSTIKDNSYLQTNTVVTQPGNAPLEKKADDRETSQKQDEMAAWIIEAQRAAQQYVSLIDKGQYGESWNSGAKLFQRTVSQKEWEAALGMARSPLGAAKSRTLKDEKAAFDPKGLPKGAYMVVEFNTAFEKAPRSGELLTLMREGDGTWKVLTYQVN